MISKFRNYYYALKYLHPNQIFFRIYFRFFKLPKPKLVYTGTVSPQILMRIDVVSANSARLEGQYIEFNLLNSAKSYPITQIGWSDKSMPKLWLYQIHYFDFIHNLKREEAISLIRDWIQNNKDLNEVGWEPYATSLRIINWIIFLTNENVNMDEIKESLWHQFQELQRKLEFHLMGNHLWENYRASIFASIYFNKSEEMKIYENRMYKEFKSQILDDGAHAELAPMYQSIMLTGLCQLSAFYHNYGIYPSIPLAETINRMAIYLAYVSHPDGKVAQLNDSAIDFSIPPKFVSEMKVSSRLFQNSGHARLQNSDLIIIADVGPVAYKYFSGHAHSDNLTFELSYKHLRLIVDPGISTYEEIEQRQLERKTDFHNTLIMKNLQQSETWKSFRLGRRSKDFLPSFFENGSKVNLSGSYTYNDKGITVYHLREWELSKGHLKIIDSVKCSKKMDGHISFNFNPEIRLSINEHGNIDASFNNSKIVEISSTVEDLEISNSFSSQNFGVKRLCQRLLVGFKNKKETVIETHLTFI